MNTNTFTSLDILPDAPPVKIVKPWFALGWVIGVFWATLATTLAIVFFGVSALPPKPFLIGVAIAWLIALFKYFKGVRYLELYTDMVLVYTLDPVTPAKQIPYDKMSVVLDLNEVFFIRKAQFTGGYSLKKVYWQQNWEQLKIAFSTNAAYVMQNYLQKSHGGLENVPMPFFNRRNRGFGILGVLMYLYELLVGVLLWIPYAYYKSKLH